MFAFGALAVIAFGYYFAVVAGMLLLTPFVYRLASLARKHRASRSQVIVCAVTGLILIALSALALYATRYI